SCDLVAFSSGTNMFRYVIKYSSWIKDRFGLPTICGGVHPTVAPEESISAKGLNMVCVGEGEEAMAELCEAMEYKRDFRNIRNIWVKDNGRIHRNPPRSLIRDLDKLPFYDWRLFDIESLEDTQEGIGSYLASRGCPFKCSYCVNHQIRKIYESENTIVRFQSAGRVIEEIKAFLRSYPFIRYLVLHDDTLIKDKVWFSEFISAYKSHIHLPYMCNTRPELVTEAAAEMLKDSGCIRVWIGIESGSEDIRRNVLKRPMSQNKIKEAFSILQRYGISTQTFNMVGLPYEDSKKVLATIKLNAEIGADGMQVTIFYPYPNTELFELCKREGFLSGSVADDYRTSTILSLPTISSTQIEFYARYFTILVRLYRTFPNPKTVEIIDKLVTSKFLPYRKLVVLHRIFFNALKYAYVNFVRKFYKRKSRLFKVKQ
ncbi:MAG: radical SAM protein, partial [Candidatus Brocadiaceae bacterium]|nr:radical SAM protein [Candidatus Brocadiaceae bacterium]